MEEQAGGRTYRQMGTWKDIQREMQMDRQTDGR
jgi:hypothetical protein